MDEVKSSREMAAYKECDNPGPALPSPMLLRWRVEAVGDAYEDRVEKKCPQAYARVRQWAVAGLLGYVQ